ncbi:hypothetical protein MTO96_022165 [Rhipicephalus appendiculatus]
MVRVLTVKGRDGYDTWKPTRTCPRQECEEAAGDDEKKGANDKDGNRGLSLEERRHRDAEMMRLKQKKAAEGGQKA